MVDRPFEHWSLSQLVDEMIGLALEDPRVRGGGPPSEDVIRDPRATYRAIQSELDHREAVYRSLLKPPERETAEYQRGF